MSSTPRARPGAYPQTPATAARGATARGLPPTSSPSPPPPPVTTPASRSTRSPLPAAPGATPRRNGNNIDPLIPLRILDAPTQRFYAFAVYAALMAWRFYDWVQVVEDNSESFWLFLKWIAIDFVFLFGLPELRIPWLELSQPFAVMVFFFHAVFDWMLMFNVGLPWQAGLLGLVRVFYDRELAISEHNVRVSSILQNSSLITGKQIINILPEGSAVLNPEGKPFCLGTEHKTVKVPIFFNATVPVEVELVRVDLETNEDEIIKLSKSQLKEIQHLAKKQSAEQETGVVNFDYPVKKPGAYRLGRVLDEYKLEVQRRTQYTFVVPCPSARVGPSPSSDRCLGDLSDLSIEVEGTPPLKINYSKTINGVDHSLHFQSLQPEGFHSPLVGSLHSTSLTIADEDDVSWARSRHVTVGLNESMNVGGEWQYSIAEVRDAFGNTARYTPSPEDPEPKPKPKHLVQNFGVNFRPHISLHGCDLQNPLRVPRTSSTALPVHFNLQHPRSGDTSYTFSWQFSPIDTLTKSGDHGDVNSVETFRAKNANDRPQISAPGLYTLRSVSSASCEGEVKEPSSCLLFNPVEPTLTIRSEEIPDTCAGNSIGRRFDIDLDGTPPFELRYDTVENGEVDRHKFVIRGTRFQTDLVPKVAGQHKFIFTQISDAVYKGIQLRGPEYTFEQDVRPPARAIIQSATSTKNACLEEDVAVDVMLLGEAPFTLEWELVHDGKRKQHRAAAIESSSYTIKTAPLSKGGEYTLALTSIHDKTGCRNFLQDELKISVRRQQPRAAFGLIENRRKTMTIENSQVHLPLRLTGDGPWKVSYRNLNESSEVLQKVVRNTNDFIDVKSRGIYEIVDVSDNQCQGAVDPSASTFEVDWFALPELSLVRDDGISEQAGRYVKQDVCEGDPDGFEINLKGLPPYHVEYEVRHQPSQGSASTIHKELDAGLGKASIRMDTAKAGSYTYEFSTLADSLYNNNRKFKPLVLEQKVNAKPSASFVKPGQTFKYCMTEGDAQEKIPITLTGVAPFYVEIEIKHQSGSVPETYRIPSIDTNTYGIQIPRSHLKLGTQHVRIRKVRDARGCQRKTELGTAVAPSVQVQLFDAPSIYPLETRTDYCVGERIAYTLSGTPPFEVWYTFDGVERKAKAPTTNFRRVAEAPGEFAITGVADKASECRAVVVPGTTAGGSLAGRTTIHPMPAVKISKGRSVQVDIHEGGEVEILFEFWGTPPFEFTYTRSTNARRGQKSVVLETRHDTSEGHSKIVRASQEGTYEVVAIKDQFCSFSTQPEGREGREKQKLLQF